MMWEKGQKCRISGWEFLSAGLFALLTAMQSPLHPFSRAFPGTDSSVYLYAAKRMTEGQTLYVDFFEHKGPLLYWLNYLPVKLGNGNPGALWLLELLLLFLDGMLVCRIAGIFVKERWMRALTAAIVLYPLGFYFEGGNFTEEYALPMLLAGMYIFLNFMAGDRRELPVRKIFLAGVLCALVILLRINMIVLFGTYSLVLVCFFIKEKRGADLSRSIAAFAGGVLTGLAPAGIFLWVKGMLPGFWDAYVTYNMQYSVGSNGIGDILRAVYVFWTREPLLPLSLLVLTGMLFRAWKDKEECQVWICLAGLLTLAVSLYGTAMSGRTYGHYAMLLLPCFVVPAAVLVKITQEHLKNGWITALLCGLALFTAAPKNAAGFGINILDTFRENEEQKEIAAYMEEHSKPEDHVIVLGNYCYYYLESGRKSESRFFYQNPTLDVREEYREEFFKDLTENPPVLMIAPEGDLPFEDAYLEELVQKGIYQKEENDTFTAYLLNTER